MESRGARIVSSGRASLQRVTRIALIQRTHDRASLQRVTRIIVTRMALIQRTHDRASLQWVTRIIVTRCGLHVLIFDNLVGEMSYLKNLIGKLLGGSVSANV